MQEPTNISDSVIFQLTNSVMILLLKRKGFGDDHIVALLDEGNRNLEVTAQLVQGMDAQLEALLSDKIQMPQDMDHPWMMEIANAAVEENSTGHCEPRHGSAQGYACAMSALKIALDRRGTEFADETFEEAPPPKFDKASEKIIQGMIDLYCFSLKEGKKKEQAAEAAIEWVAEQHGIVDITALGLNQESFEYLCQEVIKKAEASLKNKAK